MRIPVINVFRNITCFSCSTYASSQFGGKVGGLYVKPIPLRNGGKVKALTPPILLFGATNLYSSITVKLRIMLSKIPALKMHIRIMHIIASSPNIADINSRIC